MLAIKSNEAKIRFAEMLRKVEAGQEIGITRHGKLIACLSPYQEQQRKPSERNKIINKLKTFRKHKLAEDEPIAEMRTEGRR